MSQENVEIVRTLTDAFAQGDYEGALKGLDPEIEMVGPSDVTAGGAVTRGHEEISQTFGTFLGAWADYRYEVRNVVDCGDKVLVEAWQSGRGRKSGVEVSESVFVVWTLREGKAVRFQMTRDRAEALEAAGLSE